MKIETVSRCRPIKASCIDGLESRWLKLEMYKHHLSLELDVLDRNGVVSAKTLKKAKSDNPDVIFNYLNDRMKHANKIIEENLKPKIFEFCKNLNKKN